MVVKWSPTVDLPFVAENPRTVPAAIAKHRAILTIRDAMVRSGETQGAQSMMPYTERLSWFRKEKWFFLSLLERGVRSQNKDTPLVRIGDRHDVPSIASSSNQNRSVRTRLNIWSYTT